jgi:hypothetical protein
VPCRVAPRHPLDDVEAPAEQLSRRVWQMGITIGAASVAVSGNPAMQIKY